MLKLYKNTQFGLKLVDIGVESRKEMYVRQGYIVKMFHPEAEFKEKIWKEEDELAQRERVLYVPKRKVSLWSQVKSFVNSLIPQMEVSYAV
jgi:hypothetical protein